MSILLELAVGGLGFLSGGGLVLIRSKFKNKKIEPIVEDEFDSVPWLWRNADNESKTCGYQCPKCSAREKNKEQPPYCDCEKHFQGHFHYHCKDCQYKVIMRTYGRN